MKFKIVLLLIFISSYLFAGGSDYNSIFGARTTALNGMYFAGNSGLNAIVTNPAALIELNGRGAEISVVDRMLQYEFDSDTRGFYKSFRDDNFSLGGGLYWKLADNFIVAAAYHPVIDYRVDWPFITQRQSDSVSVILAFSMLNRLEINSISPSAAFNLGGLTIGLTANIYQVTQQISFPQTNPLWQNDIGLASYQFSYNLNAWAYGGTLGILYDVNDELRIGLSAKSGFTANLEGDAVTSLFDVADSSGITSDDISTELEIPWKFGLGFLYKMNDQLKFNIDAAYSLWGGTGKTLNYTFTNPAWQQRASAMDSTTGLSASSFSLEYKDAFDVGFGVEYGALPGIVYRAGYRFSQTPNSESTYNFLFPGVNTHSISPGLAYQYDNLLLEGSVVYYMGTEREVNNTLSDIHSGLYRMNGIIPTITLSFKL